jgi:hypothetical protein
MDKSPRPKARTKKAEDAAFDAKMAATVNRGNKNSQPDKMAKGGMCRGMGAASKGGRFGKNG